MKKIIIFLTIIIFLRYSESQGTKFCSPFCSSSCSADNKNDCNSKCNSNWIPSGQTCIPNAASGWILHDTTPDVSGGTLSLTYSDGTTPVINSSCATMSYYGFIPPSTSMTISTIITTPFY